MTLAESIAAANAADAAWQAEIDRLFPHVSDARYRLGRGAPGSDLRRLYHAKVSADCAMHNAFRDVVAGVA